MHARMSRTLGAAGLAALLISSAAFAASALADPAVQSRGGGRHVMMSITKLVTMNPGPPIMEGVIGGDVVGTFAGEILVDHTTDLVPKLGPLASGDIERLVAVYEVQAGDRSFRAMVQGGADLATNRGQLDGAILGGWLTGSPVHVELTTIKCSQPNALGGNCFRGTITVTPGPDR